MNLQHIYKSIGQLPKPIRSLTKVISNLYFGWRGYPMAGALRGCRMQGQMNRVHLEGVYEPKVSRTIEQLVKSDWICADLGANLGYFTLLLAKQVGKNGKVIAFEAHPDNVSQIQANVRLNSFESWVKVENLAIADGEASVVQLFPGRLYSSSNGIKPSHCEWNIVGHDVEGNPTQAAFEVPATSLDAYFSSNSRLDFIKIDIEGAEIQALPGMKRLLREAKPFVLIEFHGEKGWASRHELLATDYCLYDIEQAQWLSFSSDSQPVYQCLAIPKSRLGDEVLDWLPQNSVKD